MGRVRGPRGPRSPLWARICVGLGALLILLSGTSLVAGRTLLVRYDGAVHRADLLPEGTMKVDGDDSHTVNGPLNVLLVGSDYRRGLENEVWRADTIMIVHITKNLDQAYVLSIPRDLQVTIPRCYGLDGEYPQPDPTELDLPEPRPTDYENPYSCVDKINASFAFGGAGPPFDPVRGYQLLAETVRDLTGLRFDAAAVIDWYGFTKVVGALGGVRLCVDVPTTSIHTGMSWEPGCQDFNEHAALDYLRQREFPDGDVTRQRHQQQFIKAVLQQALDRDVLTDPAKLDRVIRTAGDSLTIAGQHSVSSLLFALRGIRPADITMVKFPATAEWINGVSYALPNEQTEPLFEALRDDKLDEFLVHNVDLING